MQSKIHYNSDNTLALLHSSRHLRHRGLYCCNSLRLSSAQLLLGSVSSDSLWLRSYRGKTTMLLFIPDFNKFNDLRATEADKAEVATINEDLAQSAFLLLL
jgi:hypothetical protein